MGHSRRSELLWILWISPCATKIAPDRPLCSEVTSPKWGARGTLVGVQGTPGGGPLGSVGNSTKRNGGSRGGAGGSQGDPRGVPGAGHPATQQPGNAASWHSVLVGCLRGGPLAPYRLRESHGASCAPHREPQGPHDGPTGAPWCPTGLPSGTMPWSPWGSHDPSQRHPTKHNDFVGCLWGSHWPLMELHGVLMGAHVAPIGRHGAPMRGSREARGTSWVSNEGPRAPHGGGQRHPTKYNGFVGCLQGAQWPLTDPCGISWDTM